MENTTATSGQNVNVPNYSLQPRNMRPASGGRGNNMPVSRRFPRILGGQCEFCGTLDNYQPGQYQYKLCPHYRGMDVRCQYCPDTKDSEEIVRSSTLNVLEHPFRPGELIIYCTSFECNKRFREEFHLD